MNEKLYGAFRFRKAVPADIDQVAAIYDRTHTAEEAGLTTTGWKRGIYPVRATAEDSIAAGDLYVCEMMAGRDTICGTDGCGNDKNETGERTQTAEKGHEWILAACGRLNQIQLPEYAQFDWEIEAPDELVLVLHTMVVDPPMRGMGIARAFLQFYEDTACENGCCTLRIDTNARNLAARAMYKKHGYREAGIVPCVFNGLENVDLVGLEKDIRL